MNPIYLAYIVGIPIYCVVVSIAAINNWPKWANPSKWEHDCPAVLWVFIFGSVWPIVLMFVIIVPVGGSIGMASDALDAFFERAKKDKQ